MQYAKPQIVSIAKASKAIQSLKEGHGIDFSLEMTVPAYKSDE